MIITNIITIRISIKIKYHHVVAFFLSSSCIRTCISPTANSIIFKIMMTNKPIMIDKMMMISLPSETATLGFSRS